jgi:hypothetical protein
MDIAVDVSGLGDQPRQRLAEMPLLGGKTMLFIERYLLAQATCANGVGSVIEQHVTLVGLERFRSNIYYARSSVQIMQSRGSS